MAIVTIDTAPLATETSFSDWPLPGELEVAYQKTAEAMNDPAMTLVDKIDLTSTALQQYGKPNQQIDAYHPLTLQQNVQFGQCTYQIGLAEYGDHCVVNVDELDGRGYQFWLDRRSGDNPHNWRLLEFYRGLSANQANLVADDAMANVVAAIFEKAQP